MISFKLVMTYIYMRYKMQFRQHRDLDQKRPTRYFSNKQETQVSKAIG